jgi:broad specificity phosphatase PhoE
VTTILLARHGESDWNAAGRWQGHADRPLTAAGREQAELLAGALAGERLDAAYASDLRRAWETAEIAVAQQGLDVVRLYELREVDVGSWSGLTRVEVEKRFPDGVRRWQSGRTGWSGGESYEEMARRVVAAVRRIAAGHEGGRVLAVSHGGSIRAVKAQALGLTFHEYRLAYPVEPNAELSAVVVENGGSLVLR